jgi:hypothetical protein
VADGLHLQDKIAELLLGFQDAAESGERGKDKLRISPDERDILHLVNGRATVQDIVDMSALAEFDVYRMLFELLNRDFIEEATIAVVVGIAPTVVARHRFASVALQTIVIACAVLGAATPNDHEK